MIDSLWGCIRWQHLPGGGLLLSSFRHHPHSHPAAIRGTWVHPELSFPRSYNFNKLPLEGLTEDNVQERVDAAVSVSHADSNVVGIRESQAWVLYSEVDKLEDVVRSPADEESQADGHCHAGHLLVAHPQTSQGQRCHTGGHVLEDLEKHQADNGQWYSKGQEELVKCEPVCIRHWIGQKEGTGNQTIREGHEARVHPHRDDGEQRQNPHQSDHQHRHARRAHVVEADGMDGRQVTVKGHCSEDVSADDLAVGVERSDDRTHGSTKVPCSVAQQLMDEERHPEKK